MMGAIDHEITLGVEKRDDNLYEAIIQISNSIYRLGAYKDKKMACQVHDLVAIQNDCLTAQVDLVYTKCDILAILFEPNFLLQLQPSESSKPQNSQDLVGNQDLKTLKLKQIFKLIKNDQEMKNEQDQTT